MDNIRQELENLFGAQRIRTDEPLSPYLLGTSVNAPLFITVNTAEELLQVIRLLRSNSFPFYVVDIDSDRIMQKKSIEGVVIKNNARKFDILARKGKIQSQKVITAHALVEAESGVPFNQLVRFCLDQGLGGLEEGLGIAGSTGLVITKNVELIETLEKNAIIQSLKVLSTDNEVKEIPFTDLTDDLIVLSIIFKLQGEDTKILWLKAQKAASKRGVTEYQ